MNVRHEVFEQIQKAKLHCPDGFPFLQELEELLQDIIFVPKEKVKMKNIGFKKEKDFTPNGLKMTGTLSFSCVAHYTNILDDKSLENFVKEEVRQKIIIEMQTKERDEQ